MAELVEEMRQRYQRFEAAGCPHLDTDSKIILGGTQVGAAYLLVKGDLLYKVDSQLIRLQSLFAPTIKLSG